MPNSFAVEDTILTYLTQVFLNQTEGIMQYEGVGPEDEIGAKLLQIVVNQQIHAMKSVLDMHANYQATLRYGVAFSTMEWKVVEGLISRARKIPKVSVTGEVIGHETIREEVESVLFEGNNLTNIDTYRILPDPNVSVHNVQDGAYFGWTEITDYEALLSREQYDPNLFNVRYLERPVGSQFSSRFTADLSAREKHNTGGSSSPGIKTTRSTRKITIINMYMNIIPKEWNLGTSNVPEVWFFRIADDTVVITAMPLGLNHGHFPIAGNATEFDGFSMTPPSRLEIISGLQEISNWMINSRVANVRKSMNNMFIVDPSAVHMPDFKNPQAGLLLRTRENFWGRGTKDAVTQLPVTDVTQGHLGDSTFANDMMQRGSGAVDSLQGIMRSGGERRSATEARGSMSGAVSRLEHMAFIISIMYQQDLATMYASHTQQLMTEERTMRILGTWPEVLRTTHASDKAISFAPEDLLVGYDVVPSDGTSITTASANADVWTQLYQITASNPILMAGFDMPRMFINIAQMLGAKNVQDFLVKGGNLKINNLADQEVQSQVQQGNLIPLDRAAQG